MSYTVFRRLSSRDRSLILLALLWVAATGVAAVFGLPLPLLVLSPCVLLGGIICLVLLVKGKVEEAKEELTRQQDEISSNTISQLQHLIFLEAYLKPRLPLPMTRRWAASPDFLQLLVETIVETRPTCVVEAGSGVSTIVGAYTLKREGIDGKIYSLDESSEFADQTRRLVRLHGLEDYVTVCHAPLCPSGAKAKDMDWYDTSCLEHGRRVDLLIVDGPSAYGEDAGLARYPAYPLLRDSLAPDAVILMDDAGRKGERNVLRMWHDEYPELTMSERFCEKGAVVLKRRL